MDLLDPLIASPEITCTKYVMKGIKQRLNQANALCCHFSMCNMPHLLVMFSNPSVYVFGVFNVLSYSAERKTSLGKDWHGFCLKCELCNKILSPGSHAEVNITGYGIK